MKKGVFLLCLALYAFSVTLTIFVQAAGIADEKLRLLSSFGSLISFFAVLAMLFLIFRLKDNKESKVKSCGQKQRKNPDEKNPSKEKYLEFAARNGLSRRESEIGYLVLGGLSNIQLAETLFISLATVKKHLTHIYEKTETSGRKEFAEKVKAF
ncbi:helix-turn-helix transcriptional regulator [uncultured Treponema sp.]|uniref:response regulator transcription factor n=1 Tax=uncultured Treponema sp. TaxID=162155 RepID=UPI000E9B6D59|nr:helix-turn-helix transcriptional regulator [uncultured Treponema sp.]HAZ96329.1 hypothetical protein [Treponema sp.]